MSKFMIPGALFLTCTLLAIGQDAEPAVPKAGNVKDPADLEAFFDGAIRVQLDKKHIAGAVVSVVADNKVVFTKGYGYADIAARKPVDPEKTMFRIASISKLFTWTAVMQQVEAGKVDLNTDINRYLKDVTIPATFDQPITLKNLLTHTPGFEDMVIGLFAKEPDKRPLGEILKSQIPLRVRPPGTLASYSNHGTALAGYVVECVSDQPWEEYIEQKIVKPLGMTHTLIRQPGKEQLPADLSKGYEWKGGQYIEKGFEYVPAGPAGCISASAGDMAKFMLAHLNNGKLEDASILKPETARQMREPLFRHVEKVSPMGHGFIEEKHNGLTLVGHGGDTIYFHSTLQMIPEKGVGVFLSYNTITSAGEREAVIKAFMDRYFPVVWPARSKSIAGFAERASQVAGEYGNTRHSHTSITKLAALMSTTEVKVNDDETVTIGGGESARRYVEVEPYHYRELDGTREVVFQTDSQGNVVHLFNGNAPFSSAIKRKWYEQSMVQGGVAAVCAGLFLTAILVWPAVGWNLRGVNTAPVLRSGFSAFLSWMGWLMCIVILTFAVMLGMNLADPDGIIFGLTPMMQWLLLVPQVIAVLAGITLLGALIAWGMRYWRFLGRLHYTLVALAGAWFVWFLYHWNLLSWGMGDLKQGWTP